jgi:hypothetical protein
MAVVVVVVVEGLPSDLLCTSFSLGRVEAYLRPRSATHLLLLRLDDINAF